MLRFVAPIGNHMKVLRMKVYMCLTIYCMMRNKDVYNIFSDGVSMVSPSKGNNRCVQIVLRTTKNDPQGTGPLSGRTYHIPCLCTNQLYGKSKGSFVRSCVADLSGLSVPCVTDTCPYKYLQEYITLIPYPFGDSSHPNIRFMRALSSGSNPKFLTGCYGEHSL